MWNGVVLLDSVLSVLDSGLADLVHVANEVEHLVGEAPLVEGDTSCLPRSLRSPAPRRRLILQSFFRYTFLRSFLEALYCFISLS